MRVQRFLSGRAHSLHQACRHGDRDPDQLHVPDFLRTYSLRGLTRARLRAVWNVAAAPVHQGGDAMRIGFIGIGKMGAPMALRLAGAGHPVTVFDASQEAVAAIAGTEGITAAPTLEDAVRGAEIIVTMLPNGAIVRSVVEACMAAMADGAVLVDMSTSYPLETTALQDVLPESVALVDAPVSGGVWRAEIGTLTLITGGEEAVVNRIEPALSAMGTVVRTGRLGSGHAMKLLNNYLSASGLAAASEAVLIGRKFGLDPDVMADVFNGSTGMNNATKVKLKQHINNGAFATGFTMGLMSKDLTLARKLSEDMDVGAKGLSAMQELFAEAVEDLGENSDHSEIIKLLDRST
ncbi:MAG: NAD(P)-dependent oxidoreductase [Pseudomonadota bacterium]